MITTSIRSDDLRGVFAVPSLARRTDRGRSIDFAENDRLVRHLRDGGLKRFLYGGNAFLHHLTLGEYEDLIGWLAGFPDDCWAIPSLGPSYGRALDQAAVLRRHRFPCAMALPCGDPRDAAGLEVGLREIAQAAGLGLIVYLKEETTFGADPEAGLDVVARLVDSGVCVAVKYAVVRRDPGQDPYLAGLLLRVDRSRVISGIGERPAVIHLRAFGLPGFTTGSGCLAPRSSQAIHAACTRGDFTGADALRERFLPLEDRRDAWGPSRVLHAALDLAGVARTGPIPPFVSPLSDERRAALQPIARELFAHGAQAPSGAAAPPDKRSSTGA